MFCLTFYTRTVSFHVIEKISSAQLQTRSLNVISFGNENNTHFSVKYETESIPEHGLSHRIAV